MSQSLSNILIHIVYSTKNRRPFLRDERLRKEMHSFLASEHNQRKCNALLIGGTENHVHILCRLHNTVSISDLIGETKRQSSIWFKDKEMASKDFGWQSGYGAFSIAQSMVDEVCAYIRKQPEKHKKMSFKEEFREFLRRYEVDFDERYVWD